MIFIFYLFFDEISLCKQNSPRWDAAFCGVTSGAMLFAYVPQKERQTYKPVLRGQSVHSTSCTFEIFQLLPECRFLREVVDRDFWPRGSWFQIELDAPHLI